MFVIAEMYKKVEETTASVVDKSYFFNEKTKPLSTTERGLDPILLLQFNKRIVDHQALRFRIADSRIQCRFAVALTDKSAAEYDVS